MSAESLFADRAFAAIIKAQEERSEEALVAALREHGKNSALVASQGFAAISSLAQDNEAIKIKLGQLGACELVVQLLQTYDATSVEASAACQAVVMLAMNNEINTRLLLAAGALALVAAIAGKSVHEDTLTEARYALQWLTLPNALWPVLAAIKKAGDIKDEAACIMVVEVISLHGSSNELVAYFGCEAICNIASEDETNTRLLLSAGALAIIEAIASNHRYSRFVVDATKETLALLCPSTREIGDEEGNAFDSPPSVSALVRQDSAGSVDRREKVAALAIWFEQNTRDIKPMNPRSTQIGSMMQT